MEINTTKTVYNLYTTNNKLLNKELKLKLNDVCLQKEDTPKYLGVQLDRKMNLKNHINTLAKKANRKLKLLKTVASTKWGADKYTLRNLYLGYVRSTIEYANTIQMIASESSKRTLDKIQNNALRFICGSLRSSPIAACEVDANIESLHIRRDKAVLDMYERYKRMESEHPCKSLTDDWVPRSRLKKKSILHHHTIVNKKANLPTYREPTSRTSIIPPHEKIHLPVIKTKLTENRTKKEANATILKRAAQETINSYPPSWIHAYTDGSALNAVAYAGSGALIQFPNKSTCLKIPCGVYCSNHDAETIAIYHTLETIYREMTSNTIQRNIVIFTDSLSTLQAVENWTAPNNTIAKQIVQLTTKIIKNHQVEIVLQWIPGHTGLQGNERADKLAKQACQLEQLEMPVSMNTSRELIKNFGRQQWLNEWALGKTGRSMFKHRTRPTQRKETTLNRQEQCYIFQLRTGHCLLNNHLSRTRKDHSPLCRHCQLTEETVQHHLLECSRTTKLREELLPQTPTIESCLYPTAEEQLKRTALFHKLALTAEKGQASSSRGSAK